MDDSAARGQLELEWRHLMQKLRTHDPQRRARLAATVQRPEPHPLFRVFRGDVAEWEKGLPRNQPLRRARRKRRAAGR